MDSQRSYRAPKTVLARMQVVHLGKIAFNMQFIPLAIVTAGVLSLILLGFYYFLLAMISLMTLFAIYAIYPGFASLWAGGEALEEIGNVVASAWKFVVPIVFVLSAASIICLCFDKNNKHIARIVVSAIVSAIALVVLIIRLVETGAVV